MKKLFLGFLLLISVSSFAQTIARHKIAVFAPLYLDSAFAGSSYRFDKNFPKFLNPGLEFYQGAQMALDSLQQQGAPLDVYIYDSRSKRVPMNQRLNSAEMKGVEMIIAHASSYDVKVLAEEALERKVPFISATLPNDGGVYNNPYFVVLNSTLRTHCEGIYEYLKKFHSRDKIIMFRKNGTQENMLRDYFNDVMKSSPSSVKIEFADITNALNLNAITSRLDSTRRNVCISGSLDEDFGTGLAEALASVGTTYPTTVIGMPTWDAVRDFTKPEYQNVEIVYSTPFYYSRTSNLGAWITGQFEETINSRPTDMFYRGYETMLRFALLLLDTKKDVASNITRKGNVVFTQFDIQPVLNKSTLTLDYFENKKLYFIKYINGIKSVVN